MRNAHIHSPDRTLTSHSDGGILWEHCRCGAVRKTTRGIEEPWHACSLCVPGTPPTSRKAEGLGVGQEGNDGKIEP